MNKKLKIFLWVLGALLFLVLLMVYLSSKDNVNPILPPSSTAEKITISQGTQGIVGNMHIGVSSVTKSEYQDEAGVKQNGPVAGLQIFFSADSPDNQQVEVYPGKKFFAGQYFITVAAVETQISSGLSGSPSGSVVLFVDDSKNVRLADPLLIYASFTGSGLCGNDKGEDGGCLYRNYLYSTGELVQEYFWFGADKNNTSSVSTKTLEQPALQAVIKRIEDSGLMTADCPEQKIMDASWDYTINLGLSSKSFHNPPDYCREEFDQIDELLD